MKEHPDDAITVVADAVGMKRDELAPIWTDYVYRVRLDDRLIEILKTHSAWRLESGNHPPGAVMPDFSKVVASEPLKKIASERVTLSWK
jgi:NitT/TauT family transport system substrate-binding protein